MTGKGKSKPKKVVETSLGKAPKDSDRGPDVSHLRKPIGTSIQGLKQVISLFQTATNEVQDYINYECDVLYECRVCRTIFRSIANFILHKREYCRDRWQFGGGKDEGGFVINDDIKTSDEDSRSATPVEKNQPQPTEAKKKEILPIIDKLLKKQKVQVLAKNILNEDLSSKGDNSDDDVIFVSEENNVVLQKIDASSNAVFQTLVKDSEKLEESKEGLMKGEVLEIHGILDNNQAVVGTNGKVCTFPTPYVPRQALTCSECNFTFSTEKTLTHHIKYKHNKTCIVFPCPDCKETFSNAWSVYRHLFKVHRRTTAQVRRMRYLVHSSGIRKDQEPEKKKRKLNVESENEENQWMNNFEGDKDFQMCGGCGKRFERKAALQSHSQMCTKRIAVCNNIKKNENKKTEKVEVVEIKQVKGAAKRKRTPPVSKNLNEEKEKKEEENDKKEEMDKKEEEAPVEDEKEEVTEKISIIIEKEEEKNDKCEDADESETIITKSLDSDVTITKHDQNSVAESLPDLPEIEIFTISDDSNDCDEVKDKKALKKKRNFWNFDKETVEIPDEYKEYLNDEEDYCFLAKMLTYTEKNELMCTPCRTPFLSLYMLLRHMSLHFSWYRYQCSKCHFMSFHKYDCSTHAHSSHRTPFDLMDSTVLPIPKWKVLCTSHDFLNFTEKLSVVDDNESKKMPHLEPVEETQDKKNESNEALSETIILEDDEMPDICTDTDPNSDTTVILSDDDKESNTDRKKAIKAGPSKSNRPIRNRTKSVKTVQNDFIYDLAKALKLNDNSAKNKKVNKFARCK